MKNNNSKGTPKKSRGEILKECSKKAAQDKEEYARRRAEAARPPVICLGAEGDKYVYYGRAYKRTFRLKANEHSGRNIFKLAPYNEIERWIFPDAPEKTKSGKRSKRPPEKIILSEMGRILLSMTGGNIFKPQKLRGVGAWKQGEELIYNTGVKCFKVSPEGAVLVSDNVQEAYIYESKSEIPPPAEAPMTTEEAAAVFDLFASRPWKQKYAPFIMTGWVACAILGAFLPMRPHVWINAPAGTGKTELKNALCSTLGGISESNGKGGLALVMGGAKTTEPALRRGLDNSTRPVVMDEMEANGKKSNAENIADNVELARIASYGDTVSKGRTDGSGGVDDFLISSAFCFLSIRNSLTEEADLSRFFVLDIRKLEPGAELQQAQRAFAAAVGKIEEHSFASRLIARVIRRAHAIARDAITLEKSIKEAAVGGRASQLIGLLMSGAWHLLHDEPISEEHRSLALAVAKEREQKAEEEREEWQCLNHLRGLITLPNRRSIAMAVREWKNTKVAEVTAEATGELEAMGCRVHIFGKNSRHPEANGKEYLRVDLNAIPIAEGFRGTSWASGRDSIAKTLEQVKGVFSQKDKLGGGSQKTRRFTYIPLQYVLD